MKLKQNLEKNKKNPKNNIIVLNSKPKKPQHNGRQGKKNVEE